MTRKRHKFQLRLGNGDLMMLEWLAGFFRRSLSTVTRLAIREMYEKYHDNPTNHDQHTSGTTG
jgi:hypothetical protein